MADLVLIDTCQWISFFNRPASLEKRTIDRLLDDDRCVLIGPVVTEVLQGFRRDAEAEWVASALRGVRQIDLEWEDWTLAARLGRSLAKRGHRLPLSDLVIASSALRRDVSVYTIDPHFDFVKGLVRFWPHQQRDVGCPPSEQIQKGTRCSAPRRSSHTAG